MICPSRSTMAVFFRFLLVLASITRIAHSQASNNDPSGKRQAPSAAYRYSAKVDSQAKLYTSLHRPVAIIDVSLNGRSVANS